MSYYHDIISEVSEHHWGPINVVGKNVLDLGCGRHWTKDIVESSAIYLGNSGANKVVAIDTLEDEIKYFNENNPDTNKYTFLCRRIESTDDIRNLISTYNINAIKSDIEGYETVFYNMSKEEMSVIDELAIEYHSSEILDAIGIKIVEWGYQIHSRGKFTFDSNWSHVGSIDVNPGDMGVLFCRR